MTERAISVALILGSTREGRFGETVARWAAGEIAARSDMTVELIDPLEIDFPKRHEKEPGPVVQALRRRLDSADAFVVVTPEYNHGYSAVLKQVIDAAKAEWMAKPVAFISYGGVSGGLRAVEQLRLVFAELHAPTIRDGLAFPMAWNLFDETGEPRDRGGTGRAMTVMLDQLAWWALTLAEGRTRRPYGRPDG
jgi:NAD(P)H-dependent FMN reductase